LYRYHGISEHDNALRSTGDLSGLCGVFIEWRQFSTSNRTHYKDVQ
jgi:hypothetical protein